MLKEAGADLESKDENGRTPLCYAATLGRLEKLKWLVLEANANVESKDIPSRSSPGGKTPLSYATEKGKLEPVKFLVQEAGANVESKDQNGKTALDLARQGIERSWTEEPCKVVVAWLEKPGPEGGDRRKRRTVK